MSQYWIKHIIPCRVVDATWHVPVWNRDATAEHERSIRYNTYTIYNVKQAKMSGKTFELENF